MPAYIARRLLWTTVLLFVISAVVFLIFNETDLFGRGPASPIAG